MLHRVAVFCFAKFRRPAFSALASQQSSWAVTRVAATESVSLRVRMKS
jgi:hypothetical protein